MSREINNIVVRSQHMVTTPIPELNRKVIQKDGWNELDFIINPPGGFA
jgi:hypothetical protein